MSSKFIPKSNRQNNKNDYSSWTSHPKMGRSSKVDHEAIENARLESEKRKEYFLSKKLEIESKNLDDVNFTDIYEFPWKMDVFSHWVYDKNRNFIFQFENGFEEFSESSFYKFIEYLNGYIDTIKKYESKFENGIISLKISNEFIDFIMIRGWSNLTGISSYDLDGKYADKIQSTLGDFLIGKLK